MAKIYRRYSSEHGVCRIQVLYNTEVPFQAKLSPTVMFSYTAQTAHNSAGRFGTATASGSGAEPTSKIALGRLGFTRLRIDFRNSPCNVHS